MDFCFQYSENSAGGKSMAQNCNATDSKDDPTVLKSKPVTETKSVIDNLPPEILSYIFCKFPAVYLHSLRCVCKSWDLLIRESSFIEEHFNRRANGKVDSGIISLSSTYQSENIERITYYLPYYPRRYFIKFYEEGSNVGHHYEINMGSHKEVPYYYMTNSCHGLISVVDWVSIMVTNPSIGRLRVLPACSLHFQHYEMSYDVPLVGIGFDPLTRAYKVVRIFRHSSSSERNNDNKLSMRCEVYTLGGGRGCTSWKYIGEAPILPHACSLDDFPVVVNDAIHWIVNEDLSRRELLGPNLALSFNLKDETFNIIHHPEGRSTNTRIINSSLVVLDECLSVCDTPYPVEQMDIWMLKDDDNREWVKQCSINLRAMYERSVSHALSTKPVWIRGGKMVFCSEEGSMDYYDLENKNFVEHEMLAVNCLCCAPYIGGLVWPEL